MGRGPGALGEQARAFEHHVHTQRLPRQLGGVANRADGNSVAVDRDALAIAVNLCIECPVHAVVLEQVRIDRAVAQVVDGDDLQVLTVALGIQCAKNVAADAAKTIDCDT